MLYKLYKSVHGFANSLVENSYRLPSVLIKINRSVVIME
jgi:hypothetical protein